ncbi:Beta-1,4-galactosyltransferase [Paramixta manurensis]|uniref:Beta-1,4-galactosyltransferase n=1 Tax=Paramixta manurensis TaxID=2740817 RepID=A0A6M8UQ82_9GAMM|nr:Beta-1,4-galactosyltransferase [Erwiniaceae bacterium PD-1]
MTIPVYIISLARDKKRRNKIEKDLREMDIDFVFFDAIDAKNDDNKEIISSFKSKGDGPVMTNSEIACTISHQKIYHDILEKKHKWSIILEDDVKVDERLKHLLNHLNYGQYKKLDCKNLYLLGGQKGLHEYPVLSVSFFNFASIGRIRLRRVTYNKKKVRRACCYLISYQMCQEFVALLDSFGTYRADNWNLMYKKGIITDFYLSEIISHPIVTPLNSNLESERLMLSGYKTKRSKFRMGLKKIRSWIRVLFFSLQR